MPENHPSPLLSIEPLPQPSRYLPCIDVWDADVDFLHDAASDDPVILTICRGGEAVGLASYYESRSAELYLYVFPPYWRQGIGRRACALLEDRLRRAGAIEISSDYRDGSPAGCAFAGAMGYQKWYAASCMSYRGSGFPEEAVPVRSYRDEDYPQAQALSAEAFHLMRLKTGSFPDSTPEIPSEAGRKRWAETAQERFVWVQDGEIIGCAHLYEDEIDSIAIKPAWQDRGFGRRFIMYLINHLQAQGHASVSLYCVVGNDRAHRLYERLGFREDFRNHYVRKHLV